jgi:predicted Zn finger-like uncharacterized protein
MNKIQPGKIMETTCSNCQSRFRISLQQLKAASGKAECGECGKIFNALASMKNFDKKMQPDLKPQLESKANASARLEPELSLHEAMYGDRHSRLSQFAPLLWLIGILLLSSIGIAQAIYYQRYPLIENPRYQKQVLTLCQLVPCNEAQFSSTHQIKMLERNVFTHPVEPDALMVTGSFVNQAVFEQKLPKLLVSLFDIQGNLIANRLFTPSEYLQTDKNRRLMVNAKPVQFRLEISDPGTNALTYEFEFM